MSGSKLISLIVILITISFANGNSPLVSDLGHRITISNQDACEVNFQLKTSTSSKLLLELRQSDSNSSKVKLSQHLIGPSFGLSNYTINIAVDYEGETTLNCRVFNQFWSADKFEVQLSNIRFRKCSELEDELFD